MCGQTVTVYINQCNDVQAPLRYRYFLGDEDEEAGAFAEDFRLVASVKCRSWICVYCLDLGGSNMDSSYRWLRSHSG